jgi:hypothetical protein
MVRAKTGDLPSAHPLQKEVIRNADDPEDGGHGKKCDCLTAVSDDTNAPPPPPRICFIDVKSMMMMMQISFVVGKLSK